MLRAPHKNRSVMATLDEIKGPIEELHELFTMFCVDSRTLLPVALPGNELSWS